MANSVNSENLAEKIKDEVTNEIFMIKGPRPNLAILIFGDTEECKERTKDLEEEAVKVGIDTSVYICAKETSEKEAAEAIGFLNDDDLIDAIYIMRPIPENLEMDNLQPIIYAEKDLNYEEDLENINQSFFEANLFKNTLAIFKERKERQKNTEEAGELEV
jgi:5,10-methylene-tetrahydrofolate dehydrogenase/methenyl tetrahydrofolate cyclohydrolase